MSDANKDNDEADEDKNKPIYTVWHGYNVVLTENCHPSEMRKRESTTPPLNEAAAFSNNTTQRTAVRRSSGKLEDYGWLRQLDLRNDVPTIDEIRDWKFDVLQFEDTVLIQVFIKLLEYYNLLETFNLDRDTLARYANEVMNLHHKDCYYQKVDIEQKDEEVDEEKEIEKEEEEKDNSKSDIILCEYHNWYHAMSCVHTSFLFLTLGGADEYLNPIDLFCIIFGALIHDLDHPGTNSDFEVKRSTSLAKLYDNDAVLERHSINMGLSMCQKNPELDCLKPFKEKEKEYIAHYVGESVLATDPARHGGIVKGALEFVEKGAQNYQQQSSSTTGESDSSEASYFDRSNPKHRQFIGRLILHSADISNPVQSSFDVAADWAIRVVTEFTRQAEKEKQLQLPVTEFMDGLDSKYKISKLQIGFFNFMVKPLFHTIGILFPKLKMLEEWGVKNNLQYQAVIDEHDLEQKVRESMDMKEGRVFEHYDGDKQVKEVEESVYRKSSGF